MLGCHADTQPRHHQRHDRNGPMTEGINSVDRKYNNSIDENKIKVNLKLVFSEEPSMY